MTVNWDKVKGVLAGVAPTVATALGGPYAGIATRMVLDSLGKERPEDAIEALTADPQAIVQVKLAELEFQKFMEDAGIKRDALVVEDRKDARGMAVALKTVAPQLAIVVGLTAMIAWVLDMLFTSAPPPESRDVLFMLLGQLSTAWAAAIAFFVGTTQGSARKTAMMGGRDAS